MSYSADRREPDRDRRRRDLGAQQGIQHGDRRRSERRQTGLQAYLWNVKSGSVMLPGR